MNLAREVRILYGETGAKLSEGEYHYGKLNGILRSWSVDGVLTLEAQMSEGEYHGNYKSWWSTGQLKEEGIYHQGKRCGIYRWHKESGEIWQENDCGSAL